MIYSQITWKQLTDNLYIERSNAAGPTPLDDVEAARLWTEAARRVKLIARKGFRRTIPICDLEDIEQRVLIKLLDEQTLHAAAGSNSPGIYIAHMIRNEALDFLRRRTREEYMQEALTQDVVDTTANREFENAAVSELFARLACEIDSLSVPDRNVLARKFWDGMDIDEIATEMHLPYSTVAKRLFRAVARLRVRFEQASS